MTKHSHIPYTSSRAATAPRVTIQTENTNIHHMPYTNIQHTQHSKVKKTLSLTTAATQQTFPQTPTQSLQMTRGVARGGRAGYICPRAPRYRGRQNEAYKTFTRVKTIVDYVNYI